MSSKVCSWLEAADPGCPLMAAIGWNVLQNSLLCCERAIIESN